ncbi:Uncharacterized protein Fot_14732 [Forsythia ovata]|uniref:Uncharacterized protein n=1 Tax=Forsythia ovata TaxID=205694 RepID=A0ABD1W757_9LAMI
MALAPTPLSYLSPFSLLNPTLTKFHTVKPTFIIFKSTRFYAPEPDGAGPAAPTRGDIFLERHISLEACTTFLSENKELKKKKKNKEKGFKHLRHEKALIVKLVDTVDFNGSFLAHVRDLAGANPMILVVTKVDLLPKRTALNCVGDWVVEATMKKRLKEGMSTFCNAVCESSAGTKFRIEVLTVKMRQ